MNAITHPRAGVWVFRVRSFTEPSVVYLAQFIRRRGWFCTCPDFTYRKLGRTRLCKHLRALRTLAALKHGISRLAVAIQAHGGAS